MADFNWIWRPESAAGADYCQLLLIESASLNGHRSLWLADGRWPGGAIRGQVLRRAGGRLRCAPLRARPRARPAQRERRPRLGRSGALLRPARSRPAAWPPAAAWGRARRVQAHQLARSLASAHRSELYWPLATRAGSANSFPFSL